LTLPSSQVDKNTPVAGAIQVLPFVPRKDHQRVAPVHDHVVVRLDFDLAVASMQHDVHVMYFLQAAYGIALQERAGRDVQADHAVVYILDAESLRVFDADC
jgi:hypothetical protein